MLKKNYRKIGKKNDNDVDANLAQLKCSNNKCYASTFRYVYIYIYRRLELFTLNKKKTLQVFSYYRMLSSSFGMKT